MKTILKIKLLLQTFTVTLHTHPSFEIAFYQWEPSFGEKNESKFVLSAKIKGSILFYGFHKDIKLPSKNLKI